LLLNLPSSKDQRKLLQITDKNEYLLIFKFWFLCFNLLSFQPLLSFLNWIIVQQMYIGCHKYQSWCDTYNPRWQHPPSSQFSGTDMVYFIYLLLNINVREYRRGNQFKRNWQHRVHQTKKNKSKTQCLLDISMHKQTQIIYSS
jgi:hypothetical protein